MGIQGSIWKTTVKPLKSPYLVVHRSRTSTRPRGESGLDSTTRDMTETWVTPTHGMDPLESGTKRRSSLCGICVGSWTRLKPLVPRNHPETPRRLRDL